MKNYEYVRLDAIEVITMALYDGHRSIIDDYSSRGFRYVGYIPIKLNNLGIPTSLDLVFEEDV